MSYLAKAREPISSLSHCIGAVVFAAATLLLVGKTLFDDWSPKILVGVIVFGASLVALYSLVWPIGLLTIKKSSNHIFCNKLGPTCG